MEEQLTSGDYLLDSLTSISCTDSCLYSLHFIGEETKAERLSYLQKLYNSYVTEKDLNPKLHEPKVISLSLDQSIYLLYGNVIKGKTLARSLTFDLKGKMFDNSIFQFSGELQ